MIKGCMGDGIKPITVEVTITDQWTANEFDDLVECRNSKWSKQMTPAGFPKCHACGKRALSKGMMYSPDCDALHWYCKEHRWTIIGCPARLREAP